ncbi:diguanylate cyclase [Lysinibacillus louembei]|uniref:Diguanylate cyclase n=1 Tax=Lysinibacillus louembei TaxID=1470088 RepID=A0ABZ0S2A0_9BACI|nr:diguanylate cyclase [Lysinibacillus louembei]WPK13792.1 diguanylate cyclase [Lysinibacillus louembei]
MTYIMARKNKLLLFGIIFIIAYMQLPALSASATERSEKIILGKYYDILRDKSNSITIEEIISGRHDKEFEQSEHDYLLFWHTTDTIWLRLSVQDLLLDKQEYWIEAIDKLDSIEMFVVQQDGSYTKQQRGLSHIDQQNIPHRSNLFQVYAPNITEIYFKLEGTQLLPLSMVSFLYTADDFTKSAMDYKFFIGIFYGFLLALLIYNLFLYFSFKEKAYLYYVLYITSFIFYQATMNSLDVEVFGHILPKWLLAKTLTIAAYALLVFMLLFSIEFLELKKYVPSSYKMAKVFLVIALLSFVAIFVVPSASIINNFTLIYMLIILIFLWGVSLRVLRKGQKMARFYIVGWTVLLGTIIVQALSFLTILPFHPYFFEHVPALGAMFEATFLSLALGDKINLIKKEHQEIQNVLNETLEHKVRQRTQQLEKAKQELEQLANTDRLTQISNRVKLDSVLEKYFATAKQSDEPFSIILLDIDNFKEVNDTYGHQVGDQVLIEFAQVLKNAIREQDIVGRWGGEEFLIICPHTSLHDTLQLAEVLRVQVANSTFSITEQRTSSFGVTSYVQGDTLNTLLTRADNALYKAKEHGKNRVEYIAASRS